MDVSPGSTSSLVPAALLSTSAVKKPPCTRSVDPSELFIDTSMFEPNGMNSETMMDTEFSVITCSVCAAACVDQCCAECCARPRQRKTARVRARGTTQEQQTLAHTHAHTQETHKFTDTQDTGSSPACVRTSAIHRRSSIV